MFIGNGFDFKETLEDYFNDSQVFLDEITSEPMTSSSSDTLSPNLELNQTKIQAGEGNDY